LVSTDHGSAHVSGGPLSSTLSAAPSPLVAEHIQVNPSGPTYSGDIQVSAHREFAISGYVDTSHGRVQTTLEQSVSYRNRQEFDVSPSTDIQNVQQSSSVDARTSTRSDAGLQVRDQHFSYPLSINFAFIVNADGSLTQTTTSEQRDLERDSSSGAHEGVSTLSNEVRAADTLSYDAGGNFLGPSASQTTQSYRQDADGRCYSRTLTAQAQKLVAVSGAGCQDD